MSEKRTKEIQTVLAECIGKGVQVLSLLPVGGGSINEAVKAETSKGSFFVKWNHSGKYPGMFEAESKGLRLLAEAGELQIPEIISCATREETAFLVLEFIAPEKPAVNFWDDFGRSLARLHKHTFEKFGLDHGNYIGSLPQSNVQHKTWTEFFIRERLEPQIRLAKNNNRIGRSVVQQFDNLFKHLPEIFPAERPSLLHGDLWNGNYLVNSKGKSVLIDPAVYFGHREMDLAMTRLFGGFDMEFYHSYNAEFPLEKDWKSRTDICNLYPLMVHVNLFGGGYLAQVEEIIKQF